MKTRHDMECKLCDDPEPINKTIFNTAQIK